MRSVARWSVVVAHHSSASKSTMLASPSSAASVSPDVDGGVGLDLTAQTHPGGVTAAPKRSTCIQAFEPRARRGSCPHRQGSSR